MEFLIVCPLVFVAGFIDAIAGGGGLISIPAYLLAGLPVHQTIATNKLSSFMGTCIATLRYAKSGFIVVRVALVCVVTALIGSTIGANLALSVDEDLFRVFMLIALPVIAFYVLRNKDLDGHHSHHFSMRATMTISSLIAFVIGIYDGFFGPGTGTFLMLALTGLARMELTTAAGATKVINLSTNFAALVVFLVNDAVLLPLGLTAGLFSIAGNWLGARFFTKKGGSVVRPVILIVLVIFAIKLIVDLMGIYG